MLKYISNCNTSFVTPVYRKIKKKKKENIKYSFPHSCALTLHAKKTSIKTEKNKTLRTGRAPSRRNLTKFAAQKANRRVHLRARGK